ncbi:hypothetical protein CEXT_581511 [Caerostris extrusa]|uniref:Uncharacterized protein n=1 Tax=Caerostris extrusa TaxID=172846 RepID=A0AAV4N9Z9_CAEEX|nr:hypothetical protein CEXT_581511 [Caerostris extrusa]
MAKHFSKKRSQWLPSRRNGLEWLPSANEESFFILFNERPCKRFVSRKWGHFLAHNGGLDCRRFYFIFTSRNENSSDGRNTDD